MVSDAMHQGVMEGGGYGRYGLVLGNVMQPVVKMCVA